MDDSTAPLLQVRDATCLAVQSLPSGKAPASEAASPAFGVQQSGGPRAAADSPMPAIFRGIDLDVRPGEILDLVGPSGSGKSSLLTCIARLNPRADARLTLEGTDADDMSVEQWRTRVAYLPQKSLLPGDTVRQAILLPYSFASMRGAHAPDDERIRTALDAVGLADVELTRDPHDLSGGQAARVSMIRSILTFPKVLLADEVDAGLDDDNARLVGAYMADFAHRTGMALIRVRHRAPDGLADATATLAGGIITVRPAANRHDAQSVQSVQSERSIR